MALLFRSGYWEKEPWNALYLMKFWYGDVRCGVIPGACFDLSLKALLHDKGVLNPLVLAYAQRQ